MKERPNASAELDKLGRDIERFGRENPSGNREEHQVSSGGGAAGMRIGLELVTGVMAGFGIGYFLDNWLGTTPLFMVAGLILGMAAGVYAMVNTTQVSTADATQKED